MGSYEAVKVRLDPTPRQERLMASHAGAARFAYNAGLAHVKESLDNGELTDLSHYALLRWWNANKDVLAVNRTTGEVWWSQNSKEAYNMALHGLARGFSNWAKSRKGRRKGRRVGFPKFKSKNGVMRFAYSTGFTAPTANDPYGLKLPRIGRVHCMENVYKPVNGARLIRISVSRRAGHWYASLTVEREPAASTTALKLGAVGVDLGVKNLATLSDGTVIPNPRALGKKLKALRKAQQALSRKVKGSVRREKARERVARLYARVTDARMDAINKATFMISQNYGTVCIEDLNVAGMVKNHHLARSVSDAALGEFRRQLEYKTARSGAVLRVVKARATRAKNRKLQQQAQLRTTPARASLKYPGRDRTKSKPTPRRKKNRRAFGEVILPLRPARAQAPCLDTRVLADGGTLRASGTSWAALKQGNVAYKCRLCSLI